MHSNDILCIICGPETIKCCNCLAVGPLPESLDRPDLWVGLSTYHPAGFCGQVGAQHCILSTRCIVNPVKSYQLHFIPSQLQVPSSPMYRGEDGNALPDLPSCLPDCAPGGPMVMCAGAMMNCNCPAGTICGEQGTSCEVSGQV